MIAVMCVRTDWFWTGKNEVEHVGGIGRDLLPESRNRRECAQYPARGARHGIVMNF